MTVWAVSGAAGYGKTFRLMQRVGEELRGRPLTQGQMVLALTFMHGARQRLEQKLRAEPDLRRKFDCMVVDGFARSVRSRWRMLATSLGQPPTDSVSFDQQCALSADLVARPAVGGWLASRYPVVILDEAQDLDGHRLRLIQGLAAHCSVLVAFDDFQCLRSDLRPSPVLGWLPVVCKPEVLDKPQRTKVPALLEAASALRAGEAPKPGKGFKLAECLSIGQAAALLASAVNFPDGAKSLAVITPSRSKGNAEIGFADGVIEKVATSACGTRKLGPFRIHWENSDSPFVETLQGLKFDRTRTSAEVLAMLAAAEESTAQAGLVRWVVRQREVMGRGEVTHAELLTQGRRLVASHRARAHRSDNGRRALTVHQAKNREFDGVVVIWPYTVGQDAEGKRRLLYNAVTRAKKWCVVIVQGKDGTAKPPFI